MTLLNREVFMKKIGDLMMEMGFNKEAPDSLKEAFIRHLVKKAEGVELEARNKILPSPDVGPSLQNQTTQASAQEIQEQLVFDFYKKASN
jgi:hypothetical protein